MVAFKYSLLNYYYFFLYVCNDLVLKHILSFSGLLLVPHDTTLQI